MNVLLSDNELYDYLERISERGCEAVSQLIIQVEKGETIPEIEHLDAAQQDQVITELKKVMAVYTSCEITEE